MIVAALMRPRVSGRLPLGLNSRKMIPWFDLVCIAAHQRSHLLKIKSRPERPSCDNVEAVQQSVFQFVIETNSQ